MAASISQIRRWSAVAVALLVASVALAACGGGSNDNSSTSSGAGNTAAQTTSSGGGGGTSAALAETAQESGGLSFSRSDLTAKAGNVTLTLDNPNGNSLPHAIEVEGNGVEEKTQTIQPGGRGSVTVNLRPGRYEFYCPVDGHKAAGMKGTLTVS
jgi:uncharacterized cupredoxin-like copper-binding protein